MCVRWGRDWKGTGEMIHLFQAVFFFVFFFLGGGGGGGRGFGWGRKGDWEGDSLISNCIEISSQ